MSLSAYKLSIYYIACTTYFILFQSGTIVSGLVCPSGTKGLGDTCFKINAHAKVTWDNARSQCKTTQGSDLLVIRNNVVFDDIKAYQGSDFWIGATDVVSAGNFKWVDGSDCCKPEWWRPGEPNDSGTEECVHFWTSGFNDLDCHDTRGYICEYQACNSVSHCIEDNQVCSGPATSQDRCKKCMSSYYSAGWGLGCEASTLI